MANTKFLINETLAASGSDGDTATRAGAFRTEGAYLHVQVNSGGPVDVRFDVRATPDFDWQTFGDGPVLSGVSGGATRLLDIGDVPRGRVSIVNQASGETDVQLAVMTE